MTASNKLPRFVYSKLIKGYLACRAQDAALIEIYLVLELQKKFIENDVQYFPRLRKWEGATVDIITQNIDSYSRIILQDIEISTLNDQGLWCSIHADLSDFIDNNVKYVNRESILKQLTNLSKWEDVKFLNEEKFSFIELEKICSNYLSKHRKHDPNPENNFVPLDELKKEFYHFMKILHKKRRSCYSYFINCLFATMQNLWSPHPIKKVIMAVGKNGSGKTMLLEWASEKLPKIIPPQSFGSTQISGMQFEWHSGAVFPKNCPLMYCSEIRIIDSNGFPKDKLASDFVNMLKQATRKNEKINTRKPGQLQEIYVPKSLIIFNANSDADKDEVYRISQAYWAPYKVWDRVFFVNVDILDLIPGTKTPKFKEIHDSFVRLMKIRDIQGFGLEDHFPYVVLNYYVDCVKTLEFDELGANSSYQEIHYRNLINYLDKSIFDGIRGFSDEFKTGEHLKEKSKEETILDELFTIFDEEFPSDLKKNDREVLNATGKNIKQRIADLYKKRNNRDIGKAFSDPRLVVIKQTDGFFLPCIHNSHLKLLFDDDSRWSCNKYEEYYKKDDKQGTQSITSTTFFLHDWRADKKKKS